MGITGPDPSLVLKDPSSHLASLEIALTLRIVPLEAPLSILFQVSEYALEKVSHLSDAPFSYQATDPFTPPQHFHALWQHLNKAIY